MSYCPEDGQQMPMGENDSTTVSYRCPRGCLWQYSAEDGTYTHVGDAGEAPEPEPTDPDLTPAAVGTWLIHLGVEAVVTPTQAEINDVLSLWDRDEEPYAEWVSEEVAMARFDKFEGMLQQNVTMSAQR